jgi:hypothetical protein
MLGEKSNNLNLKGGKQTVVNNADKNMFALLIPACEGFQVASI